MCAWTLSHTYGLFWNQTVIQTYIDNPNNVVLNVPINETFFQRGGWSGVNNPWAGGDIDAPFDQVRAGDGADVVLMVLWALMVVWVLCLWLGVRFCVCSRHTE